jgi:hypothetical protein
MGVFYTIQNEEASPNFKNQIFLKPLCITVQRAFGFSGEASGCKKCGNLGFKIPRRN